MIKKLLIGLATAFTAITFSTNTYADSKQVHCLAQAIYFEARGEPHTGQIAVANVVINRTESGRFPRTVCGVVNQCSARGCQFSWVNDSHPNTPRNANQWNNATRLAGEVLSGAHPDHSNGAKYFYSRSMRTAPSWARRGRTALIGNHIFIR